MFVCVVPLPHPSSRVIINDYNDVPERVIINDSCYMLNVCVCCPVTSSQ